MVVVDYIDVRKSGLKKKLRNELVEVEKKYSRQHKPFCFKAAKEYYEDLIDNIIREAQRKEGKVKEEDLKLPKIDFERFGDIKDFKLLSTTSKKGTVKHGNTILEQWVEFKDYIYTPKGYGVSIEQPVEVKEVTTNTN